MTDSRKRIVHKDGKSYLIVGDRALKIRGFVDGVPQVKVEAEEVRRPDGSQDVIIRVPFLTVAPSQGENDG